MELWSWSLMRCWTSTSGRTWPSQGWWKRKDSLKTRQMGWNSITTGKCKVWARFVRSTPSNRWRALRSFMNCFRYRDDGFKLWNALHNYVEKVVNGSYPSEQVIHTSSNISIFHWSCFGLFSSLLLQEVEKDEKLTEFFASLADPKRGNIPGFPRTPGDRWTLRKVWLLDWTIISW